MKRISVRSGRRLGAALLLGCLCLAQPAWAGAGDPEAGARKSVFCAYCHGVDGNMTDSRTPRLAGQDARVLSAKMKRQGSGAGANHPMLSAFITGGCLTDADIDNLAAYYARQPVRQVPCVPTPAPLCQ